MCKRWKIFWGIFSVIFIVVASINTGLAIHFDNFSAANGWGCSVAWALIAMFWAFVLCKS